ncbi:MAG TPA: GAF domain-containing protein, partial [Egibacteraceae bacterium]|nr:GAF domain-containing protein [Egibacteraceae bacterium]
MHSISNQLLGAVRDPARLRALHLTQLLDSPPEESFDRFTRLAARVTKAPVSLVTLVDEDRQFFKSCLGLPEPWASDRETPLSHSFCQHVVAQGEPLIVTDARTDARLHDNLAIRDLDVVAYAGWPVLAPDGSVLGSFCVIDSQPREWTEEELANLADIAGSVNAEIAFRHTLVAEHTARQEAVQANLRLRFVAEASTLLTQTLDADRVLQELAKIAVPALADWCIIDVAEGPFLHRRAFAHAGAGREAIAAELSNYPPRTDSPAGPGRAFRVGGPEIVAPVTSEWIEGKAQDARHRELLYAMGMDSAAFVPLVVKRRAIGVMTFVSSDPARRYTEDDLEVFVGLARHTALAVENARLYAERDNVARTLQKTLLPPAMPQVPGYDLAVAYEPSGAGNEVGGDFYDAFRNAWGDWVIAIGDVCGKGVH